MDRPRYRAGMPRPEPLAKRVLEGYENYGTVHVILRAWHAEEWPAYPPGAGQLLRYRVGIPRDTVSVDDFVHAENIGLDLATQEARMFFARDLATKDEVGAKDLDVTVRTAVRSCLARGDRAAIWINFEDDMLIRSDRAAPWHGGGEEPINGYWGTWYSQPVILTNFVRPTEVWVAGNACARLMVYPEREGADRIVIEESAVGAERFLEARMWCEFKRRDAGSLHTISVSATNS